LCSAVSSTSEPFDVIIFSETWLSDDVPDMELGLANYNLFRCDRNPGTSVHVRGGGVLIAVKSGLFCRELRSSVECVEQVFVDIHIRHKHLVIGAVYIPPSSDINIYNAHCNAVESIFLMSPNSDILIIGDYNLPNMRWFNETDGSLQYVSTGVCRNILQAESVYTCFNELNLYQHNKISNLHGNTLDLLFSTLGCIRVLPAHDPLLPCDPFHPPLSFSLPTYGVTPVEITRHTIFDFKRANFSVINDYLNYINWDVELRDLDVNDAVNFVYYHFNHIIDSCVPFFTISGSSNLIL